MWAVIRCTAAKMVCVCVSVCVCLCVDVPVVLAGSNFNRWVSLCVRVRVCACVSEDQRSICRSPSHFWILVPDFTASSHHTNYIDIAKRARKKTINLL